ncbi:MAG TPA: CoA transferase [Dermatophilaceae bacterium]|jgi:crotonobetainyl-CoA:carnitine CoA-transferase CaiB-like acyl-CoA transferase
MSQLRTPTIDDLTAEALERPDIAMRFPTKESAILGGDVLVELVAEAIRTYTVDRCIAILDRAGVWCAPVNDFTTVVDDPYVAWSRRSVRVRHPDAGEVELVQNPLRFHGSPLPIRYAPPMLGQHTDEVLAGVGFDAAHRQILYGDGVIGCQTAMTKGSKT